MTFSIPFAFCIQYGSCGDGVGVWHNERDRLIFATAKGVAPDTSIMLIEIDKPLQPSSAEFRSHVILFD